MVELLTTISILGVLGSIAVESYSGIQSTARESVATDTLELLNRAVLHFNQTNWNIVLDPVADATSDELAVLRTLQYRNPSTPGSPYISPDFSSTMSSSSDDYRIQWNGRAFELLSPGTTGAGILTGETSPGSGSSTPATFATDYQPLRANQHE